MKKRLILILNGKGGVGKSFFAVNFVQYLKDRQIPHAAFDSDDENSTLKRFHSEVEFINASQPTEIDKMVHALDDHDVVVVDCRAASTRIFLNYFEETRLPDILDGLGARLTIACPVNHELDSIYQIQRLANAIGGKADFVIIRNEVHGEGFELFDKSKLRQKLLSELGAKEIVVR
jgi:cellulose biosynthesis protein BcsQ